MIHMYNASDPIDLTVPGRHSTLTEVRLSTGSDLHGNPVQHVTYHPCRKVTASGRIFILRSRVDEKALVILSGAPVCAEAKVTVTDYDKVTVDPAGYDIAYEYCPLGMEEQIIRAYFRGRCRPGLFAMVNNWGDGRGRNSSESFCYKEIDAAAEMGLDVVQVDDGWQIGNSDDAKIMNEDGSWSGYRAFDGDFWELDREKFPNGLEPLVQYAAEKGVTLGLWFAPDSRNGCALADRDAAVLKKAYDWGFRYFKLDMIYLPDRKSRDRFVEFLKEVSSFGPDISLQLDVTGIKPRLGFTDGCGFGKIFVENRYAWRADYFPTDVLRTLWELSRYFPADRFQFELPNVRLFADRYDPEDPLAAPRYSPAWRFASVMVSCPLFWMEAQYLDKEDADSFATMVELWKEHRDRLSAADVRPAGGLPDGFSLTGFIAEGEGYGYLIALREAGEESVFDAGLSEGTKLRVLASSDGVTANGNTVTLPEKYAWAFCAYDL